MKGLLLFVFAFLIVFAAASPFRDAAQVKMVARSDDGAVGACSSNPCQSGETCCENPQGPACCPAANACCCPDGKHCCESGYQCSCTGTCPGSSCSCSGCSTSGQCQ